MDIIVAVELGSTSVRAIAGKKQLDGSMQVLAFAEERCTNTIRKGVIDNIDKTTQAIANVTRQLGEKLDACVTRIYVGLAGQSMHSERNIVPLTFGQKTKITDEVVDKLNDINKSIDYPDSNILEVIPQEYRIGNRTVNDPVGVPCEQVEATFLNVVARRDLYENIVTCVRNAGLELVDVILSPLALADSQLSQSERSAGCALVDIGAETTTVTIFKNDIMRHLVVIPLGGANVTADLTTLGMETGEAEVIKLKHGTAYYPEKNEESSRTISVSFDREVKESELKTCTAARYEEIICNIGEQTKNLDLVCGIVLTGGGALASGITDAFGEFLRNSIKIHQRKGLPLNVTLAPGVTLPETNLLHTLIALLQHGELDCVEEKVEKPIEEQPTVEEEQPATAEVKTTEEEQPTEEENAETEDVTKEEPEEEKEPAVEKMKKKGSSIWSIIKGMLEE